jgi:hypothetical protein
MKRKPAVSFPSYFKDEHNGISPIETIYGTRYLLKWPDYRGYSLETRDRLPCKKWNEEVKPWLLEKGIKVEYHDSRRALMFPTKDNALMFKLSWDINDFK